MMSENEILERLEKHLAKVEKEASELYIIRLRSTIYKLKHNNYSIPEMIADLQSIGFNDLAANFRNKVIKEEGIYNGF